MEFREVISAVKCGSFEEAESKSIQVLLPDGAPIGRLVPVGDWILQDSETIELIRQWRQRAKKMFLTQFQTTFETTTKYLKEATIAKDNRILFLILDEVGNFVGHIGLAGITDQSFDLDNLMRGAGGGHPQLIFHAEVALLRWAFKNLESAESFLGVLSYNWMVIDLHAEVGYELTSPMGLLRKEDAGFISHDFVDSSLSNVEYHYVRMTLSREKFLRRFRSSVATRNDQE